MDGLPHASQRRSVTGPLAARSHVALGPSAAQSPWPLRCTNEGERVPEQEESAPRRTIAEKLNSLFASVQGPRGEYSLEEVSEGIRERGRATISPSYIWQLRKGMKDNPTKKHMEALADFFGVSASYFHDDEAADRIEAELATLSALRDLGVRRVALRAAGLSPRSLEGIAAIIEGARQAEGLTNTPDESAEE